MPVSIIPCLQYRDAPAMIEWLCEAFGFARHAVHENEDGGIAHAQLTLDESMIMLSTTRDERDAFGQLQRTPEALGGNSQSPYIVVPDADAVYARAQAASAEIVMEIADQDHGGRLFSCRDPEGYLWNFGTYDPWVG